MNYQYCANPFEYSRFVTKEVNIGGVSLGGNNPIRIQSMTNTAGIDDSVKQILELAEAGCEYARLAVPSVKDAKELEAIRNAVRAQNCDIPIVADIHFNPKVALLSANIVDKVRINPGNFSESSASKIKDDDNWYQSELKRIEDELKKLILVCKEKKVALRIGSNHGSLSPRIVNRYGDTPLGMVEAAMEYIRILDRLDFHDIVLSMKSSNVRVMVHAYRLLQQKMINEGYNFPLHLGVTEAGEGDEGRIKSAAGIGCLLEEGIGDTIRVSLTEDPVNEIPVARLLADKYSEYSQGEKIEAVKLPYDPFSFNRRSTRTIGMGGGNNPVAVVSSHKTSFYKADLIYDEHKDELVSGADHLPLYRLKEDFDPKQVPFNSILILEQDAKESPLWMRKLIVKLDEADIRNPIILKLNCGSDNPEEFIIHTAATAAPMLIDGLVDGLWINSSFDPEMVNSTAFKILQACRSRITETEYISCPSCSRTLYDIQTAVHEIRSKTSHLKGLKLAVMGCIVNGPGEMADADYGYVGSSKGNINLYKGKELVMRNVKQENAVEELINLIKKNGDWKDPS